MPLYIINEDIMSTSAPLDPLNIANLLASYIHNLKNKNAPHNISWSIIDRGAPYQ